MFQSVTPRPGKIAFQVDPFPVPAWEEAAEEVVVSSTSRKVAPLQLLADPCEADVPDCEETEVVEAETFTLSSVAEAVSAALEEDAGLEVEVVSVPPNVTAWSPPKKAAGAGLKRGVKTKRFGSFFGQ